MKQRVVSFDQDGSCGHSSSFGARAAILRLAQVEPLLFVQQDGLARSSIAHATMTKRLRIGATITLLGCFGPAPE